VSCSLWAEPNDKVRKSSHEPVSGVRWTLSNLQLYVVVVRALHATPEVHSRERRSVKSLAVLPVPEVRPRLCWTLETHLVLAVLAVCFSKL